MSNVEIEWCCTGFQIAFEERFDHTIFVFCELENKLIKCGPTFWLGMRSVAFEEKERFAQIMGNSPKTEGEAPLAVTVATWRPIRFCPWCGKNLGRFYRKLFHSLADQKLSDEHGWGKEAPLGDKI